jgi:cytochrome c peroxidase
LFTAAVDGKILSEPDGQRLSNPSLKKQSHRPKTVQAIALFTDALDVRPHQTMANLILLPTVAAMLVWPLHAADATYDREAAKAKFKRPAQIPFPRDNQFSLERVVLGKALFFDTRLSGANSTACASCHNPAFSCDALPRGVGFGSKELGRRTPTILNVAWGEEYFWDGRAESLEAQALGPIKSAGEMNMPLDKMVAKVSAIEGYKPLFEKAYPNEGISEKTVAKAIATFERTVVSGTAPFDEWVNGRENAIPDSAKHGFDIFNTKALCVQCHAGWNFTDDGFHDIGVADDDIGRGKVLPQIAAVQHAFKTPTLRNVAQRRPYLHNGSGTNLVEVMRFYNQGGAAKRDSLDINIKPLNLTDREMHDLCDFMFTLSSRDNPVTIPTLPTE